MTCAVPDGEGLAPGVPRRPLREALLVFGAVTLVCAVLVQLRGVSGFLAQNVHGLIAAVFLFVPTELLIRQRESFSRHGLGAAPLGKGLLLFSAASLLVFPLFTVAFYFYYRQVCGLAATGGPLPRQLALLCSRWVGSWSNMRPALPEGFWSQALTQVVVVALPEEYFFRGYLQTRLQDAFPSGRRVLGVPVGASLPLAALLFAIGHFLVDFNMLRLAVFFPGLVFGAMRQATGSILAGVLFHACSNLLSDTLHRSFFP